MGSPQSSWRTLSLNRDKQQMVPVLTHQADHTVNRCPEQVWTLVTRGVHDVDSTVTMSDVLRVWLSEVQLVGQEGQTPPGGFVSDLIDHLFQGVDVPANFLRQTSRATVIVTAPCL